ncbi:U-box domain-containing protein 25-like [Curcuma longa]|uniref:U-box domain-containing protein 25-like n=1 Tax=Curcuma longa TaxID=136217 RepID=UPI003D9DC29B
MEAVAASGPSGATAERALAALELLCMVSDGAAEVRSHPATAPTLVGAVEKMTGKGREYAIGVMAAKYGGAEAGSAPTEAGRAVVAAMQGDCSARARRKGAQLLRALYESGRLVER